MPSLLDCTKDDGWTARRLGERLAVSLGFPCHVLAPGTPRRERATRLGPRAVDYAQNSPPSRAKRSPSDDRGVNSVEGPPRRSWYSLAIGAGRPVSRATSDILAPCHIATTATRRLERPRGPVELGNQTGDILTGQVESRDSTVRNEVAADLRAKAAPTAPRRYPGNAGRRLPRRRRQLPGR